MRRASTRTNVFASVVVGFVVIFGVLSTVLQDNSAHTLTASTSSSVTGPTGSTATTTATNSASTTQLEECLLPIGPSANLTVTSEENTTGTLVSYPAGRQEFYPISSCPQPVSNETYHYGAVFGISINDTVPTSNYQLALAAVTNPDFISLENGTPYLYAQPGYGPVSSSSAGSFQSGPTGYEFYLIFYLYGNATISSLCRVGLDVTAGIAVGFVAPEVIVNGTIVQMGWDLNDPSIEALSASYIMMENSCF